MGRQLIAQGLLTRQMLLDNSKGSRITDLVWQASRWLKGCEGPSAGSRRHISPSPFDQELKSGFKERESDFIAVDNVYMNDKKALL